MLQHKTTFLRSNCAGDVTEALRTVSDVGCCGQKRIRENLAATSYTLPWLQQSSTPSWQSKVYLNQLEHQMSLCSAPCRMVQLQT